jgi:hypothetical protein
MPVLHCNGTLVAFLAVGRYVLDVPSLLPWSIAMQNQTRNLVIVALIAALVVVTCWNQSTGQVAVPAKPAAVKWEYKITTSAVLGDDPKELDSLGAEGWEACAAYAIGRDNNARTVILKRPKAGK